MLRIETDMKQSEVDQESFDHRKALSDAINEEEEQQRQPRTAHAAANSAQSSQRNAMRGVSSPKQKNLLSYGVSALTSEKLINKF